MRHGGRICDSAARTPEQGSGLCLRLPNPPGKSPCLCLDVAWWPWYGHLKVQRVSPCQLGQLQGGVLEQGPERWDGTGRAPSSASEGGSLSWEQLGGLPGSWGGCRGSAWVLGVGTRRPWAGILLGSAAWGLPAPLLQGRSLR